MEVLLKLAFLIGFTTAYGMTSIAIYVKLEKQCESESSIPFFFGYFAFTGTIHLAGVWYGWNSDLMLQSFFYLWVVGPIVIFISTRK